MKRWRSFPRFDIVGGVEKVGEPALKNDRIYTYGDYKTWPGDERWELIDGTAWNMSPAPNRYHQHFSMRFAQQIVNFLEGKPCEIYAAPFDVLLPDYPGQDEDEIPTIVQPDISVICDKSKLTYKGCTGAPEFIIEIISPYTSRKDMAVKFELYEFHGVKEYWIVDPGSRYVHVYIRAENGQYPEVPSLFLADGRIECFVLKGLTVDLRGVFTE